MSTQYIWSSAREFSAGNIANFEHCWRELSSDPWIISAVQGILIPFQEGEPVQMRVPHPFRLSPDEREILQSEIKVLLEKGVIERVKPTAGQFISNVFLRPKPKGHRVILDLTEFNKFVKYEHFKMTSLQSALELMRPGAWMASVDLRDAYYTVKIHNWHRKFLRFQFNKELYQYVGMANGLACAPRFFTKLLVPLFASLQEKGHECFPYIDDSFVIVDTFGECQKSVEALCTVTQRVGFFIHPDKSVFRPQQNLVFLGFQLDTRDMSVTLTEEKKQKFTRAAQCEIPGI